MFNKNHIVEGHARLKCPMKKKWISVEFNIGCMKCQFWAGFIKKDWGIQVKCNFVDKILNASYRRYCPMSKDWGVVLGKESENISCCSKCPYLKEISYKKKDIDISCDWNRERSEYNFDKKTFEEDDNEIEYIEKVQ